MKILIVEDDFISRRMMQTILSEYGECDIAVDGNEAVEAVKLAIEGKMLYDLICLDIMMPNMNGREALKAIRALEEEHGLAGLNSSKILMTTALDDPKNIIGSFKDQAEGYLVKPISAEKISTKLRGLGLIE